MLIPVVRVTGRSWNLTLEAGVLLKGPLQGAVPIKLMCVESEHLEAQTPYRKFQSWTQTHTHSGYCKLKLNHNKKLTFMSFILISVLWFKTVGRQGPSTWGPFPATDPLWCFHPGLGREKSSKLSQERGRNARRSPFKSAIEANNHHMLFWSPRPGKLRKRRKGKKAETI